MRERAVRKHLWPRWLRWCKFLVTAYVVHVLIAPWRSMDECHLCDIVTSHYISIFSSRYVKTSSSISPSGLSLPLHFQFPYVSYRLHITRMIVFAGVFYYHIHRVFMPFRSSSPFKTVVCNWQKSDGAVAVFNCYCQITSMLINQFCDLGIIWSSSQTLWSWYWSLPQIDDLGHMLSEQHGLN